MDIRQLEDIVIVVILEGKNVILKMVGVMLLIRAACKLQGHHRSQNTLKATPHNPRLTPLHAICRVKPA